MTWSNALEPCFACGCKNLTVYGSPGCVPDYLSEEGEEEVYENHRYVFSERVLCDRCGLSIEAYAVADDESGIDGMVDAARAELIRKWNAIGHPKAH